MPLGDTACREAASLACVPPGGAAMFAICCTAHHRTKVLCSGLPVFLETRYFLDKARNRALPLQAIAPSW
jgi:hypothetical protein